MADLFVKYGFRSANNGTYWSAFRWTANVFDINYKEVYIMEIKQLYMRKLGIGVEQEKMNGYAVTI